MMRGARLGALIVGVAAMLAAPGLPLLAARDDGPAGCGWACYTPLPLDGYRLVDGLHLWQLDRGLSVLLVATAVLALVAGLAGPPRLLPAAAGVVAVAAATLGVAAISDDGASLGRADHVLRADGASPWVLVPLAGATMVVATLLRRRRPRARSIAARRSRTATS